MLEFSVASISAPDSIAPLQTFAVDGRVLFVDADSFHNKELLQLLTPASDFDLQKPTPEEATSPAATPGSSARKAAGETEQATAAANGPRS